MLNTFYLTRQQCPIDSASQGAEFQVALAIAEARPDECSSHAELRVASRHEAGGQGQVPDSGLLVL